VINEKQLTSMSERMLNNVKMTEKGVEKTYGDDALNLNRSIDTVRKDKANEFSRMLFDYRESDDGISADEYAKLDRYIKNPGTFNVDTASIRGDLRSTLEIEIARQYANTQLVDPNNVSHIDTLKKGAAIGGGLFNKNKIKTNNKELVTKLTTAEMARAKFFDINEKEVRAKIEEQLSNIPGYRTILADADISYEQQKKNEDSKNILLGSSLASSANSSEQVNKAIKYHMDNRLSVPESLMNKQNKLVKDNAAIIIEENNLGIDGKFDIEVVEGKKVFNYDKYNTWNIKVRDAIKKAYPGVTDTTLDSEIGRIVAEDQFLKKSLDAHMRTTAQVQKLTQLADRLELERAEVETNKRQKFEDNPVGYISDYISTSTGMKGILTHLGKSTDSAERDDFVKTVDNIQQVSQKIYNQLKSIYKNDTEYELMQKAERTFSRLEINVPDFWGNKVSFSSPSDDEIIREARGSGDSGIKALNALDAAAIKRLEDQRDRTTIPSVKIQLTKRIEKLRAGN